MSHEAPRRKHAERGGLGLIASSMDLAPGGERCMLTSSSRTLSYVLASASVQLSKSPCRFALLCFNGYGIWDLHQFVKRQIRAGLLVTRNVRRGTESAHHFQTSLTHFMNICCPPRIPTNLPIRVQWTFNL